MKLIVGWYNQVTGQLVDIPGFDHVSDSGYWAWVPAYVEPYGTVVIAGEGEPIDISDKLDES